MQLPGQSAGSRQGQPQGLVGGFVDRLINKPAPPQAAGGPLGVLRVNQNSQPPSPAQQIQQQVRPERFQDPSAVLKARVLYGLGVRRSDNPVVDAELQTFMQNPPATPLRSLGQGLLVTGTVNRLLQ